MGVKCILIRIKGCLPVALPFGLVEPAVAVNEAAGVLLVYGGRCSMGHTQRCREFGSEPYAVSSLLLKIDYGRLELGGQLLGPPNCRPFASLGPRSVDSLLANALDAEWAAFMESLRSRTTRFRLDRVEATPFRLRDYGDCALPELANFWDNL